MNESYIDPTQVGKLNYAGMYKTNPDATKVLVKRLLNDGLVRVHFKKVNGEFRDMQCTTNASFIPEQTILESLVPKIVRKENEDVCKVFDVEKKEWRSFRWDHLLDVVIPWTEKMYLVEPMPDPAVQAVFAISDSMHTTVNDK